MEKRQNSFALCRCLPWTDEKHWISSRCKTHSKSRNESTVFGKWTRPKQGADLPQGRSEAAIQGIKFPESDSRLRSCPPLIFNSQICKYFTIGFENRKIYWKFCFISQSSRLRLLKV